MPSWILNAEEWSKVTLFTLTANFWWSTKLAKRRSGRLKYWRILSFPRVSGAETQHEQKILRFDTRRLTTFEPCVLKAANALAARMAFPKVAVTPYRSLAADLLVPLSTAEDLAICEFVQVTKAFNTKRVNRQGNAQELQAHIVEHQS